MAFRHQQGFEVSASTGGLQDDYETWVPVGTPTFVGGRLQGTALFVGQNVSATFQTFALSSQGTWVVGIGNRGTDPGASGFTVIALLDTGGEQIRLDVIRGPTDTRNHIFKLMRGATLLAQSVELNFDSWEYAELKVVLATGATGSYSLKVNEVVVGATSGGTAGAFSESSVQTSNLGTAVANKIKFGLASASALGWYLDDIYVVDGSGAIRNDFLGDYVIEGINPVTPDDTAEWSIFPAAPATHFDKVDDPNSGGNRHDADATYAESPTDAQSDLYAMSDLVFITGNILCVTQKANVRLTSSGSRTVKFVYKDATPTTSLGTGIAITQTSFRPGIERIMEQDPNTAADWTVARVNAGKMGLKTGP